MIEEYPQLAEKNELEFDISKIQPRVFRRLEKYVKEKQLVSSKLVKKPSSKPDAKQGLGDSGSKFNSQLQPTTVVSADQKSHAYAASQGGGFQSSTQNNLQAFPTHTQASTTNNIDRHQQSAAQEDDQSQGGDSNSSFFTGTLCSPRHGK